MALLAQDPGDGVHDVGFAAAVRPHDAGEAGAAESQMSLLAKGFEAGQIDSTQLKQGRPFWKVARVCSIAREIGISRYVFSCLDARGIGDKNVWRVV